MTRLHGFAMEQAIAPSPFKDDQSFVTAALRTISYQKLVNGDTAEQNKLLDCGERGGSFYLDLTQPESQGLWEDYENVLGVMAEFFDQPIHKKLPFAYGSDVQG